jgi:hypothetical protein
LAQKCSERIGTYPFNGSFEIILFLSYLERHHPDVMASLMPAAGKRAAAAPGTGGSSLWLRRRAAGSPGPGP